MTKSVAIKLIEGSCRNDDKPCDMVQKQEVILDMVSLSVMNQEEQSKTRLTTLEILTKSVLENEEWLWSLHDQK